MSRDSLKRLARQQFEKQALSEGQLKILQVMQQESNEVENVASFKTHYYVAASFAVLFLVAGLFHYLGMNPSAPLDERIGVEVAGNHINLKPLEVHSSDIKKIRQYFTELNFSLIESSLLADSGSTLIGGRYCSIQGVTAAQLRLKNNGSDQVQSLYQVEYDPDVFSGLPKLEEGGRPIAVYAKGLDIQIWVEKGILFALTQQKP